MHILLFCILCMLLFVFFKLGEILAELQGAREDHALRHLETVALQRNHGEHLEKLSTLAQEHYLLDLHRRQ